MGSIILMDYSPTTSEPYMHRTGNSSPLMENEQKWDWLFSMLIPAWAPQSGIHNSLLSGLLGVQEKFRENYCALWLFLQPLHRTEPWALLIAKTGAQRVCWILFIAMQHRVGQQQDGIWLALELTWSNKRGCNVVKYVNRLRKDREGGFQLFFHIGSMN